MKNTRIIQELCLSYAMELETVQNYYESHGDAVAWSLSGPGQFRRSFKLPVAATEPLNL